MSSNSDVLRLRFDADDRLSIKNRHYIVISTDANGYILRNCEHTSLTELMSYASMQEAIKDGDFRYERNYFHEAVRSASLQSGVERITDLGSAEQNTILCKLEYCTRFLRMEANNETSRSDRSMSLAIVEISKEVLQIAALQSSKGKRSRSGAVLAVRAPPKPKALRRWLAQFEKAGFEPRGLRNNYRLSGNRTPRLHPMIVGMMHKTACLFASETRPSKKQLYDDLCVEIKFENQRRIANGEVALDPPSRRTFHKVIKELDPFHVACGRLGIDAAKRKFRLVGSGPEVSRPLERVEIDECMLPLHTLLINSGDWSRLSPGLQSEVERKRLQLSVAIDCATRCILAVRLARTSTVESAQDTVRMIVSDKTRLAQSVGASSSWPMCGTPEAIVTDMGSNYVADKFKATLADLGVDLLQPPAGQPQLRGRVERVFKTIHTQLISRIPGRTFENVVAAGDYPSAQRAVATIDELCWLLVRYVVDVYHQTPHEGLAGETPIAAWWRLTKIFGVRPPPDGHTMRSVFGRVVVRTIDSKGICYAGLQYNSKRLHEYRLSAADFSTGTVSTEIRIDPLDLGSISVLIGDGKWIDVPCMRSDMSRVSLSEWKSACSALEERFGSEKEISRSSVQEAILAIKSMVGNASAERGTTAQVTEEVLEWAKLKGQLSFGEPIDPSRSMAPRDLFSEVINVDAEAGGDARFGEAEWKVDET